MFNEIYTTITTGPPVTAAVAVACCCLLFGTLVFFAVVVIEYVQREIQIRKLIRAMKSGWLSGLMLLALAGIAHAGPECKTYGAHVAGHHLQLAFACETAGIGGVETIFDGVVCPQVYIYLYYEDSILILKLAEFEYHGDTLIYPISGLVFTKEAH